MNSGKSGTGGPVKAEPAGDDVALVLPDWSGRLVREAWTEEIKERRRLAILRLLKFCKRRRKPVSGGLMKGYLAGLEAEGNLWPETKEALRWFVVGAGVGIVGAGGMAAAAVD